MKQRIKERVVWLACFLFFLSACLVSGCAGAPPRNLYSDSTGVTPGNGYHKVQFTSGPLAGDTYDGEWINGKPNGQGRYTWASGLAYTGGFKNGIFHGRGTFTGPNGELGNTVLCSIGQCEVVKSVHVETVKTTASKATGRQDSDVDQHEERRNAAIEQIVASHIAGHVFEGGNLFSAAWNEAMALARKDGLKKLYHEMAPEADPSEILALVMVTELTLDGKLTLANMTEKVARETIKEKMNEIEPGSGNLSSFAYGVSKRMYSANKE